MNARHFLLTLVSTAAFLVTAQATAQQRPIRLVVPYAAGGPIDVTTRILAERVELLERRLLVREPFLVRDVCSAPAYVLGEDQRGGISGAVRAREREAQVTAQ